MSLSYFAWNAEIGETPNLCVTPAKERHPGMLESGAGAQCPRLLDSGIRRNDDNGLISAHGDLT